MGITRTFENKVLNHLVGVTGWTAPTNLKAALYTVSPTSTTAGTEHTATAGYAQQGPIAWNVASGGAITNAATISWTFSGTTQTIVAIGILDPNASIGSQILFFGALTPFSMTTGQTYSITAGSLSLALTNNITNKAANLVLNHLTSGYSQGGFGPNAAWTQPSALYGALMTQAPLGDGTGGVEVSQATGYGRSAAIGFTVSGNLATSNADFFFPQSGEFSGKVGSVTTLAIVDNNTPGPNDVVYFYGPLTSPQTVAAGTTLPVRAGNLNISLQ